jgi:hypothetical protein
LEETSAHISVPVANILVSDSITRKGNPSQPGNNHTKTQHIGYFHKKLSQIPGLKQAKKYREKYKIFPPTPPHPTAYAG